MEAAWLAAVIVVPLFFNVYSSRIFEPDKITLLRSLAVLILIAWIVKLVEMGGARWERIEGGESRWKAFFKIPLVAPVVGIAVLYIIATIFSITPSVSLWGSYQRLQGTYTTLSYLVIFGAIGANLRSRGQVERLITVIIISSLPVALYGVLQKYKIDPVPWGGDTSRRIAANLGNSIFVAAYLIMVFPLTIGRIVETFKAILSVSERPILPVIRATIYIFIAALQVIAIYMSGSRGPALGWMASLFLLVLLLSLYWRKRTLTLLAIGGAAVVALFLVVFNISGGPLEELRQSPAIGRFGLLLDAESNSALVRKYIWEGAADLVSIHEPLEFPDGKRDSFNFLRPLIGYGPESMYVAYNSFYVPELAHVEKRNASPDRSHNETWDSLVITGVLGILAYLAVFVSVFYYGLKWIGLIPDRQQRRLFFILILVGGVIGAGGMSLWRGVEYFGVGMPFGMLIGLLIYITQVALVARYEAPRTASEAARSLTLIVLLAAITAHFVEINFGIAIAVTRTYFWVYSALLLCVGYILPLYQEYDSEPSAAAQAAAQNSSSSKGERSGSSNVAGSKKRRTHSSAQSTERLTGEWRAILVASLLTSTVMATLAYNYVSNQRGSISALEIVISAMTRLANRNNALSYGILALVLTTWLLMVILLTSETGSSSRMSTWWRRLGWTFLVSAGISLIYWLWQAGALASIARTTASNLDEVLQQVQRYENLLGIFYIFVFLLVLTLAYLLPEEHTARLKSFGWAGAATAAAGLILVLVVSSYTNLRVIQADIAYKLADPFTRSAQWPVAISVYNRANALAPTEDYYYLFLGRAYLEHAKTLENVEERDALIRQAEADLVKAQSINPLNTDHTANLARLYTLWASYATTPEEKLEKANISDDYFSRAVVLSPNNARLWDEWALLYLNVFGDVDKAAERLDKAREIDPKYHWTYALLAELRNRISRQLEDEAQQKAELTQAAEYYRTALELPTPGEPAAKYNYAVSLASIETQLGNLQTAIEAYQNSLQVAPSGIETWRIEEALGTLYAQLGDLKNALIHFQNALSQAPDSQKERIQNNIAQIPQP
jgi:tetratricopeptide (TPR) repeat protein